VRQYVASSGQVYAVSWDGPAMPDVSALLSTWFDRYRQGASAALPNANGLHSSRVSSSDLMVETAVRLRNFSGRAWLPDALPAGVSAASAVSDELDVPIAAIATVAPSCAYADPLAAITSAAAVARRGVRDLT
jgi:hypothetical protein